MKKFLNSTSIETQTWNDPKEIIWGFHIHQEVPKEDFNHSLISQKKHQDFLNGHNIHIDSANAFYPGYGPHIFHMWELRIETIKEDLLEKLGFTAAYLSLNKGNFSPYIHPLMHMQKELDEQSLIEEAETNQKNTLWFENQTPQNQDFFYNPPKDNQNIIIDTRSACLLSNLEIAELTAQVREEKNSEHVLNPIAEIQNGFEVYLFYKKNEFEFLKLLLAALKKYLEIENKISLQIEGYSLSNTPYIGMCKIIIDDTTQRSFYTLGTVLGWLICNRKNLPVFMHETRKKNETYGPKKSFFLNEESEIDLLEILNNTAHIQEKILI